MSTKQSRRAALRARQQAEVRAARSRKQLLLMCGAVVLVVAIAFVVGMVTGRDRPQGGNPYAKVGAQITAPNADPSTGVYTVNAGVAKHGAPTLTLYEDYQCPACKASEDSFGPVLRQLAASGEITLQFRTLTFLDNNFKGQSSYRAAMAAAAADAVGALEAYHDVIYRNQPAKEGTGYTDDQLRTTFAAQAGITGEKLTEFQKYYDTRATSDFVRKAADQGLQSGKSLAEADPSAFRPDGHFGTPTWTVNGKPYTGWRSIQNPTAASLLASIKAAAG